MTEMNLVRTRVRLSPGPLYRKAERPVGNGASNYFLRRGAPGLPIFLEGWLSDLKRRPAKALDSHPRGFESHSLRGAVV